MTEAVASGAGADGPPPSEGDGSRWRLRLRRGFHGFLLGMLVAMVLGRVWYGRGPEELILWGGAVGAGMGVSRFRAVLRWVAGVVAVGFLIVAYTPLAMALLARVERRDPLRPAAAIVVLGSAVQRDGTLSSSAQERVLHGYALLRQGYAPELVLTRGERQDINWVPTVTEQMKALGLGTYPVDVVGPVRNTHDEAVLVGRLARERGWGQVILVTHAWHMRRSAGVFEHEGVRVICSPCVEGSFDVAPPTTAGDRVLAFRCWLHEAIGYGVYRMRGWV